MSILFTIRFIRRFLALIFISSFLYSSFFLGNNYILITRIWLVTLSILALFAIAKSRLDKRNLKNFFTLTIFFFIIVSGTQTIKNIYTPHGLPVLGYEIIHYILTIFILSYNLKEKRFLDTGLVLFIVYSFRIFDLRLANNEFVLIHSLTLILALIWLEEICPVRNVLFSTRQSKISNGVYTKREVLPRVNSIFIPLVILIIIAIFSTINAVSPYKSLEQTMIMINFIFVGFLMANYLKDIRQVNLFILTLFLIGGVLIILAMYEVLSGLVTTGSVRAALSRVWIGRVGNSLPTIHANSIAGYFAALLCLIIGSLSYYKSTIVKRVASFFIIIMLFILMLTYSRLGIMSFIFALSVLLAFRYKNLINFIRAKPIFLTLLVVFIISIIALSPIKEVIIRRLYDSHSSNSSLYSSKLTLAVIKDNPLFGLGFDNYYILARYAQQPMVTPAEDAITTTRNLTRSAPHSLYLGIAFGLGIIGLLAFIWLLIDFIVYCLRLNNYIHPVTKEGWKTPSKLSNEVLDEGYEKGLLQGIFVAFISVIVHGILSMTFHLTVLPAFFWIFIGLAISIGNIKGYNKKIIYGFKNWEALIISLIIILISVGGVINPIIAERYYILSLNNFSSGQLNRAIKNIDWAKRFMPINPKFYELTAEIQIKQGLIDSAIESYKKALHFKRDFAFYYAKLGQLYQQKKMYSDALAEFNQAIMLDKYGAYLKEHYSDLGFLYEVMGRPREAITQFKKAILIDPEVVKESAWRGIKYLDEILNQMHQDYKIEKDKNLLIAKQILFSLKQIQEYRYREDLDKARELNSTVF